MYSTTASSSAPTRLQSLLRWNCGLIYWYLVDTLKILAEWGRKSGSFQIHSKFQQHTVLYRHRDESKQLLCVQLYTHSSQAVIHEWGSTSGLVEGEPIGDQLARENRSRKALAAQVSWGWRDPKPPDWYKDYYEAEDSWDTADTQRSPFWASLIWLKAGLSENEAARNLFFEGASRQKGDWPLAME